MLQRQEESQSHVGTTQNTAPGVLRAQVSTGCVPRTHPMTGTLTSFLLGTPVSNMLEEV